MEFEKLQNIIADVLNIDKSKITPETTFVDDLGADSLDVFQIIMGIEDEFDIQIPDEMCIRDRVGRIPAPIHSFKN